MAHYPDQHDRHWPSLGDRIAEAMTRAMRFASRVGLAFGLAVVGAIILGAALTDNGLVQIFVTIFAALGLWVPILLALLAIERRFGRGRQKAAKPGPASLGNAAMANTSWKAIPRLRP